MYKIIDVTSGVIQSSIQHGTWDGKLGCYIIWKKHLDFASNFVRNETNSLSVLTSMDYIPLPHVCAQVLL